MEYYSATKKHEIMPSTTTWMDVETIILNGSKPEKDNYMVSLTCSI